MHIREAWLSSLSDYVARMKHIYNKHQKLKHTYEVHFGNKIRSYDPLILHLSGS